MRNKKRILVNAISSVIVIIIGVTLAIIAFKLSIGGNFKEIGQVLLAGAFGSKHAITECLVIAIPLILAGLGVAFAFKSGLWNIGGEGQLYIGAIGATFVSLNLSAPAPLHILAIMIGAFVFGGVWAALAGFFKARLEVNEILTTIMMNFIAVWIVHYLIYGPWRDLSLSRPQTSLFPKSAWLPIIISDTRLHAGFLLGLACIILAYVALKYTKLGYSIKMLGANPEAAQYGGISQTRTIMTTMFISGGFAGLAGMSLVNGLYHYLINGQYQISPGYGYYAIGVALLGGLSPWGIGSAAIFFGFLLGAATYLKTMTGMPSGSLNLIVGFVLLSVLARGLLTGRLMKLSELRGKI